MSVAPHGTQRDAAVRRSRLVTLVLFVAAVAVRLLDTRGGPRRRGRLELARFLPRNRPRLGLEPSAASPRQADPTALLVASARARAGLDVPRPSPVPEPGLRERERTSRHPSTSPPVDGTPTEPGRRTRIARPKLVLWSMTLGVFGVTVGLRLFHLRRAYDVFLDESTYSRIAAGAAVDGKLVFGNYPFYLHGPLSFYLQAAWIHIFGITGTAIEVVGGLRVFNVLVAGVVAVLVFSIVRTVTSRLYGLIAAALFAFDPFVISFDSRLFLETLATMWVLLGFYLLLPLASDDLRRSPRVQPRAVAGGFAFGLALLTKETSAPLYVLPLVWCVARERPLRRSSALTALVTAAITYLPYPVIAIATGGASQFQQQKFGGIERMLGLVQATGYNRPGVPSLLSRVTADLGTFFMTYVLIGLGVGAALWLYRRGDTRQRLVGTWGVAALSMLAFQIVQGTIEEQMFYYLVVPSIVTVASALSLLSFDVRASRRRAGLVLAIFVLISGFDLTMWIDTHTRHDTAIVRAVAWMQSHAPVDARVAPLADGIQLLLPDYILLFNPEAGDVSPAQLKAAGTELVVTSSLQAEQGYSAASPSLLAWLRRHARRRFAATGASAGEVVIWQLGRPLPHTSPPGPERLDPRAPLSVGAPTYHG